MELIATIVPVYNRARTVRATLDAVATQTRPPDQLVVVDDGSTDGLGESCAAWQTERRPSFPVLLLHQSNAGVSAARNRGLRAVPHATLVAFLDSDDRWPADFLARAAARLSEHPSAVAATADLLHTDAWTGRTRGVAMDRLAASSTCWLFRHGAGVLSATVLRASEVRSLGAFNERLRTGQDSALLLPLGLRGPWLHLPGRPVVMGRNTAASVGEADHIARHFDVPGEHWAAIYERFLATHRAQCGRDARQLVRLLARRWDRAGREWSLRNEPDRACACYRRSLRHALRPRTVARLVRELCRRAA